MERKKIKVGDKVAVYVEWLQPPRETEINQKKVKTQPQTNAHRMPGKGDDPVYGSDYVKRRFAEATVVSLDATYYASRRQGSYYDYEHKGGILVKFAEPQKIDSWNISTAVVTNTRHIVAYWDDVVERREESARLDVERNARTRAEIAEFEPVLREFRAELDAIGLDNELHGDNSGLTGEALSVSLNRGTTSGDYTGYKPTGFGYGTSAKLDVDVLRQLVKIALKHGERVVVKET